MYRCRNTCLMHALLNDIAVISQDGVLRPGTGAAAAPCERSHTGAARCDQLLIASRKVLALLELPGKALELRQEDRALQGVHASAHANPRMLIASALSMHANFAASPIQRRIVA